MRAFDDLLNLAAERHGGREAVLAKAENAHAAADLGETADDRVLSMMARCVFNAGFNWKVIDAKWDGFEDAFDGFDPHRVAFYSDDAILRLLTDERIVRNGQKIQATVDNARFVVKTADKHGSFGLFLKAWPAEAQSELLAYLSKEGARLGGATAQYFLRFIGWDAWIASRDVCAALVREGVLDKPAATSKSALAKVQAAINALHEEGGRSRAEISRILALGVG